MTFIEIFLIGTVATFAFALGRSFIIWGTLTYLVGWPTLLALFLFGAKPKTWERRAEFLQSIIDKVEKMSKPKDYKDFETVDDLFKQLETNKK